MKSLVLDLTGEKVEMSISSMMDIDEQETFVVVTLRNVEGTNEDAVEATLALDSVKIVLLKLFAVQLSERLNEELEELRDEHQECVDIVDSLREGQIVVSESENATTGIGHGKTTGASYECDFDECKCTRIGVIWNDSTIKYPCSRELQYKPSKDMWETKSVIPYCKYDTESH